MKRFLSILLALVMVCCLVLPAAAASAYFKDVPSSSWFYSNVKTAYEQNLMVGVSDTEFQPQGTLTRAMFVTILGRVAKVKTADYQGTSHFDDVPKGNWYEPYVAWAQSKAVTSGIGGNKFAPNTPVTREQMATMIVRYVKNSSLTIPNAATPAAPFKDAAQVSGWAEDGVEFMRLTGLIIGDNNGNFNPKKTATRAEAATVFVRLYKAVYGSFPAPVNTWLETPPTPPTPEEKYKLPVVSNPIVSNAELAAVMDAHPDWFTIGGRRYNALVSINTKYAASISSADRTKPLLFLFEGAGATSDPTYLYDAMGVLVQNGKITWINLFCSTLPDTLDASWNHGTPVPTLKSGIYTFASTWHDTDNTPSCPALHIYSDRVVRGAAGSSPYNSTSGSINIHRRSWPQRNSPSYPHISTSGCQVIGKPGTGASDDYATYAATLGLINPGDSGTHSLRRTISGKVIVDRAAAKDFMTKLGYSAQAISLIG